MKIVFDFAAKRIVLDGPETELVKLLEAVRAIAPALPSIQFEAVGQQAAKDETGQHGGDTGGQRREGNGKPTMRDFVRGLDPQTLAEKVAAISHFSKQHDNKEGFSPKEMEGWFTVCGYPKPPSMPVALSDAKRKSRYMENVGYGRWRIATDGENWVIGRLEQIAGGRLQNDKK